MSKKGILKKIHFIPDHKKRTNYIHMSNESLRYVESNLRVDKWLWAVRIFKTRSLAADACKNKRVSIDGVFVKPSRILKEGEIVQIKRPPITREYKVLGLLGKRMSAKEVVKYVEDITSEEEIEQLRTIRLTNSGYRPKGEGRPTKKNRRDIDKFNPFSDTV